MSAINPLVEIFQATLPQDVAEVRTLFRDYAASLSVDLSYQGFAKELAALPGAYAEPQGRLLLAKINGVAIGCVALRRVDARICEMKRLYIRPERQGLGLGRDLAKRVIGEARAAGYSTMLLDTLPTMQSALRLYESLGFIRRPPYFDSPIEGNVFMELPLGAEEN